jgi:hypothetical protein
MFKNIGLRKRNTHVDSVENLTTYRSNSKCHRLIKALKNGLIIRSTPNILFGYALFITFIVMVDIVCYIFARQDVVDNIVIGICFVFAGTFIKSAVMSYGDRDLIVSGFTVQDRFEQHLVDNVMNNGTMMFLTAYRMIRMIFRVFVIIAHFCTVPMLILILRYEDGIYHRDRFDYDTLKTYLNSLLAMVCILGMYYFVKTIRRIIGYFFNIKITIRRDGRIRYHMTDRSYSNNEKHVEHSTKSHTDFYVFELNEVVVHKSDEVAVHKSDDFIGTHESSPKKPMIRIPNLSKVLDARYIIITASSLISAYQIIRVQNLYPTIYSFDMVSVIGGVDLLMSNITNTVFWVLIASAVNLGALMMTSMWTLYKIETNISEGDGLRYVKEDDQYDREFKRIAQIFKSFLIWICWLVIISAVSTRLVDYEINDHETDSEYFSHYILWICWIFSASIDFLLFKIQKNG